jgi:signal transduction histidine kinase
MRIMNPFVSLVARVPAPVQSKLLAAFLAIAALLIIVGAVGLQEVSGVNQRTEELIKLQRKIEAYRQVQHDTTSQLYSVSTALVLADEQTLSSTLRQLNQFGYDVDRLEFVAKDEVELIDQFRRDYNRFIEIVAHVIELIRGGRTPEARQMQLQEATPLADRLERLTNQLVNKAEADMVAGIEASTDAYSTAQWIVVAFALGSIVLALGLGYSISWSLVGPVKEIETRLDQVAAGDFTQRVHVVNRDELGALAANVNHMCQELGRLYQQLELASKHKSQFLANMSHELRTPLNAILGYTELILDNIYGETPEKMRGVLKRIESNGKHLLGLINDVLDLSKIEAGQLTLSLANYSLKDVVNNVYVAVEPLAAQKKLHFKAQVSPDLPVGRGDEQRLRQVLLNLVGNAIKFTDSGEVLIKANAANGSFCVAVSDTGPGISQSDQAKLFQEFQQADNSVARKKGGTGLGLAISKRIIEMHGGTVSLESVVGAGSTFSFTLPVVAKQEPDRAHKLDA